MFSGVVDLADGVTYWRLWLALAWEDIKTVYRRSIFGVAWITLSFLAFIVVKILIFRPFMSGGNAHYFTVYVTLGFLVWQFLQQLVTSAPTVFLQAESWIKSDPLPFSLYIFQSITRALFNFMMTSVVAIIILMLYQPSITPTALLVLPALALTILNGIWVYLLLGIICTRHRDITHLIQTCMRFMFFLSPILWYPESMGPLADYLWWNPFWHFLWIFRAPLIDNDPALVSWIFCGVVTVVGWSAALVVFSLYRKRLVFWF